MKKSKVVLVALFGFAGLALFAFFVPITIRVHADSSTPGAPAYTEPLSSRAIPAPPPQFGGVIKDTYANSKPWWPPTIVPPKGAPNILLIMLDDAGYGDLLLIIEAIAEGGTALALIFLPGMVAQLLFREPVSAIGGVMARLGGIALLSLSKFAGRAVQNGRRCLPSPEC